MGCCIHTEVIVIVVVVIKARNSAHVMTNKGKGERERLA